MSFVLTRETIDRISDNIEEILEVVKEISKLSPEMIMSDRRISMAFRYCFITLIQAILTFSNYIIVKRKLGIPRDYRESLMSLFDAKILDPSIEDEVVELVKVRETLLYKGASITITDIKNTAEKANLVIDVYRKILDEVKNIISEKK